MKANEAEAVLHAIHGEMRRDPQWTVVERAERSENRPLLFARRACEGNAAARILLSAGMHGDEPAGVHAILEHLRAGAFDPAIEWLLFPVLNPTGFVRGTRANALGIDPNRDFKWRRSDEVNFFLDCVGALDRLDLHLSLHEDWEYSDAYLYELNSSGQPSIAGDLLHVVERCIGLLDADLIDGHTPTERGFIRHPLRPDEPDNWPEAIFLTNRYPLVSYTLETPSTRPLAERIHCMRAFIETAAERLRPSA